MSVLAIDHVQLAMPEGREDDARAFFGGVLGLNEVPKPAILPDRRGVWFERGTCRVHLGVQEGFRAALKAHPALVVDDIEAVAARLRRHGAPVVPAETIGGAARLHTSDPFGNRIEIVEDRPGATQAEALYHDRADWYDLIYHWKDYAAEADRVRERLRAEGVADGALLLDAACGTGSHLVHLREHYRVRGFDRSAAMLARARAKLGDGVPLAPGELETFTTDAPVDAVTCLFSSIGYLLDEDALRRAAARFAAAVRPDGVLLVEPWLDPTQFEPGRPSMETYAGEDLKLCRMVVARVEGERSILRFHWSAAARGAPDVEHVVEEHVLWLCPRETLASALEEAGFRCRWEEGLSGGPHGGRGLLVGRRGAG